MAKRQSDARTRAEERFDKARKTSEAAQALIDSDLTAVRAKTARLRAARLKKEEAEKGAEKDTKTKAAGKKPSGKKKAKAG